MDRASGRPLVLAARRTADLPPGEPAEVARNARRPDARGVVGRLQPDVAAAPAAAPQPPPGAPDRAGTWVQVQIGTVPAAYARHGHRPAGIGTRPRRHAGLGPATGHGNLLVLAGAVPCTRKKSPGPAAARLQVPRGRSCRGPEQYFHITLPRLTRIGLTHTADPATHGQAAEAGQTE